MWQAKSKAIKPLRDALLLKQKGKCTICGKPAKDPTLDHMHQKRVRGTGRIRGAVCSMCNTFLARSENNAARHGISNEELPNLLRNMADYLEDQKRIIHPTEVPKRKKVGTREWNRVKKYYFKVFPTRRTLPKKPTYVTDSWLELKSQVDEYIEEEKRLKSTKRKNKD
jgi:5-methylcytosine-specific restriction endonuclease McrA